MHHFQFLARSKIEDVNEKNHIHTIYYGLTILHKRTISTYKIKLQSQNHSNHLRRSNSEDI